MKKLLFCAALLAPFAANAARVTNLDTVAHTVTFESAGTVEQQVAQPDQTVYFPRRDGIVGLKGGTPSRSRVSTHGILQGTVGEMSTARIPAGPTDDFTIWPGGRMYIQRRIKDWGGF